MKRKFLNSIAKPLNEYWKHPYASKQGTIRVQVKKLDGDVVLLRQAVNTCLALEENSEGITKKINSFENFIKEEIVTPKNENALRLSIVTFIKLDAEKMFKIAGYNYEFSKELKVQKETNQELAR